MFIDTLYLLKFIPIYCDPIIESLYPKYGLQWINVHEYFFHEKKNQDEMQVTIDLANTLAGTLNHAPTRIQACNSKSMRNECD